jgi:hypothetical protein
MRLRVSELWGLQMDFADGTEAGCLPELQTPGMGNQQAA